MTLGSSKRSRYRETVKPNRAEYTRNRVTAVPTAMRSMRADRVMEMTRMPTSSTSCTPGALTYRRQARPVDQARMLTPKVISSPTIIHKKVLPTYCPRVSPRPGHSCGPIHGDQSS